jgi:hypothetical protein
MEGEVCRMGKRCVVVVPEARMTSASLVSSDPNASNPERMADKAHDPVIVLNHIIDPAYAPYCMRCGGLKRMTVVEPFLWGHDCGAVHDERQVLS